MKGKPHAEVWVYPFSSVAQQVLSLKSISLSMHVASCTLETSNSSIPGRVIEQTCRAGHLLFCVCSLLTLVPQVFRTFSEKVAREGYGGDEVSDPHICSFERKE